VLSLTHESTVQISVVIPTYNRWPLLCRAIDSVLQQQSAAEQIIIVDDGSSDDTPLHIQRTYGDAVEVIQQTNRGVSSARNLGIAHARCDWIAFLDSDDEWLPGKLCSQQAEILDNPMAVLCHTEEIWIRNGTRVNAMQKHRKSGGHIFEACLPLCAISPSSVLLKKSMLEELGGFDETLPACEDYDLWLRICARHPVLFVATPQLIKYGGHADQLSKKYVAMDRFRVTALENLLQSCALTDAYHDLTIQMLIRKTEILLNGAIKHNNDKLRAECETRLQKYAAKGDHLSKSGD